MSYSEKEKTKIIDTICERVSDGGVLRNILNEKDQIDSKTFYRWLDEDDVKDAQYARAMDHRADGIFEDILEISDDQEDDVYEDKDGVEHVNHNVINRSRLRVDSRKWMLGKMNSDRYGDKVINENRNKEIPATKEEIDAQIKELEKKAAEDD